jgi:hypothetical protein
MPLDMVHTPAPFWIPSNALILSLALAGLCILAWITAKDVLLEEWRFFLLERRMQRVRKLVPKHEQLGLPTRFIDGTRYIFLGRPDFSELNLGEPDPQNVFRTRVRREIDQMVGREEYHGHKEQL